MSGLADDIMPNMGANLPIRMPPRADLEGAKFAVLEGGAGRKVGSGQFHISRAVTLIIPTILIPPHLSSSSHAAPEIVESTGIRSAG